MAAQNTQQSSASKLPPGVESDLRDFQNIQRSLQTVMLQKQQIQLQLEEIRVATEAINESTGAVFKAAGGMLIQTTKEISLKDLSEKKETLDLRLTQVAKQEKQLSEKLNELKEKLEAAIKTMPQGSS